MTDEYKIQLLNYLLGNIETTTGDDSERFAEEESISRDEWLPFLPNHWNGFRIEGMVASNEFTSGLGVLYGGYMDLQYVPHGIIILVDENFKPVKTIYKRDAGVDLRYIQYMKQAEDGTFYYIDSNNYTYDKSQMTASASQETRFVMTNNFTIKSQDNDYVLSYRQVLYFGDNIKNFYCKNMYKDPNSSHYIFFGMGGLTVGSTSAYRILRIVGLKVNVGSPNEWTTYVDQSYRLFGSAIALFENGDVRFRCLASSTASEGTSIDMFSRMYGGSVATTSIATFSYHPYIDDESYKKQSVFLDIDTVYFVQNNQQWGVSGVRVAKHIGLYKYDVSTSTLTEIYHKSLGNYDRCNLEAIYIDKCNNEIYLQYNKNIIGYPTFTADYYFQRLVNDTWNPIYLENGYYVYSQRTIYIKANFNLLQVYMYATNPRGETWFQHLIKEDYNSSNYNGTPYIDYNSLISQKGEIFSEDKLVFARNLYNRTINENTTVSTIQIPNNYLNGIQIDLKKLISQTNLDINNDTNTTSKNVYEMMFVNYINTLNLIDEDTNILYPEGASYINANINTGTSTNYNNSFIAKVRINYSTPTTEDILWQKIDDKHYQCNFTLNTSEIPSSIEFISNDETITYLTKVLQLEQNKTYVINQKIRIE